MKFRFVKYSTTLQFLISSEYDNFVRPFFWKVHIAWLTGFSHELVDNDSCMGAHSFVTTLDSSGLAVANPQDALVVYRKLLTTFLLVLSFNMNRQPECFHEISRLTQVFCFQGFWKGRLTRKIINILDINCTHDRFTPVKDSMRGNVFLRRPEYSLCSSVNDNAKYFEVRASYKNLSISRTKH